MLCSSKWESTLADIDLPVFTSPLVIFTEPYFMHCFNVFCCKTMVCIIYAKKFINRRRKSHRFCLIHFFFPFYSKSVFKHTTTRAQLKLGFGQGRCVIARSFFHNTLNQSKAACSLMDSVMLKIFSL